MIGLTLAKCALWGAAIAVLVKAVDPSPEVRQKWDDKCKAKSGAMYAMVFDSNGQPTGTCRAPPFKGCYWGPYKDPKTGADGCCEKGGGVFTTDPVAILEGGCCEPPRVYSFDTTVKKGGCCPKDLHLTWDATYTPLTALGLCCPPETVTSVDRGTGQNHCCPPGLTYSSHLASGKGECCEPGKTFSFDEASQKGDCCGAGQSFKIDANTGKGSCCAKGSEYKCDCKCVPGDFNPECPGDDGKIIENGGKKWKIFCELINHGTNDISITDGVADWGQCIANCAKNPSCKRAIWKPETKTCYLRTHGNKEDATFKDIYSSAHLVEGDDDKSGGDDKKPDPSDKDEGKDKDKDKDEDKDIGPPKHCPEVEGRIVTVGGVTYQIQCTKGISSRFDSYIEKTTKDVGECMALCSADPRCQGANLFDDGADEGCVMMKDWEFPATGSVDPGDNMMSFVPIKKR